MALALAAWAGVLPTSNAVATQAVRTVRRSMFMCTSVIRPIVPRIGSRLLPLRATPTAADTSRHGGDVVSRATAASDAHLYDAPCRAGTLLPFRPPGVQPGADGRRVERQRV